MDSSFLTTRKPWLPVAVSLFLLALLCATVIWQAHGFGRAMEQGRQHQFERMVDELEQGLRERMRAYEITLRGLSGLLMAGEEVGPREWQRAADQLQVQTLYPGIQGVTWAPYVSAEELDGLVARMRQAGLADFRIEPPGQRPSYLVVAYVSPPDERNRRVIGYDLLSEPVRREAMVRARESGQSTLSAPLRLRQEDGEDLQRGVLLNLPVYRPRTPRAPSEEQGLLGMVVGAFRMNDLLEAVLDDRADRLAVRLVDEQGGWLAGLDQKAVETARYADERRIELYGRTWLLSVAATPAFDAALASGVPLSLPLGLGLSILASLSVGALLYLRERALFITARQRERQRESEQRFRLVVEASPNAILLVDGAGRIAMVNQQCERLFGYTREELLGQSVERLLPEDLRAEHARQRAEFFAHPEQRRMGGNRELFGRHRSGRLIPLEVGLSPLRSSREQLVQAVIIDISERRLAEQRLREQAEQLVLANRYKSEFLANMSHELRTPLNSILILADQLSRNAGGNLTDKQVRHAEIIHKAGNDLHQLINDVLDLAKIESGRVQLRDEPVPLAELLGELDASLRPLAEEKGLQLQLGVAPGTPEVIRGDRGRLQQVLRNLLSNALKFTDQGEVRLQVSALPASDEDAGERLEISVCDTGIGIDPAQHERIFQAFQQIDGSSSRRFGGTGLGLAITRQLVEALGGEIRLESALGEGACFLVRLPLRRPPEAGELAAPRRLGAGPALLILDREGLPTQRIAALARAQGMACLICSRLEQALAVLEGESLLGALFELQHADLSGWALYRRLRDLPATRELPVLLWGETPPDWRDRNARFLVAALSDAQLEQQLVRLLGGQEESVAPGAAEPSFDRWPEATEPVPPAGTLKGKRVLLVDDDIRNIYAMSALLDELGIEVITALDGGEALRRLDCESVDLVLMDMAMPHVDGYRATAVLKQERGLQVPIVALTAHAMKGDRERCLQAGADDYLAKPVLREPLLDVLLRWLAPSGTDQNSRD